MRLIYLFIKSHFLLRFSSLTSISNDDDDDDFGDASGFFFNDSSPLREGIFDDLICTGDSIDGVEFKQSEHL